jgi:hypothetical protein
VVGNCDAADPSHPTPGTSDPRASTNLLLTFYFGCSAPTTLAPGLFVLIVSLSYNILHPIGELLDHTEDGVSLPKTTTLMTDIR